MVILCKINNLLCNKLSNKMHNSCYTALKVVTSGPKSIALCNKTQKVCYVATI